MRISQILFSQGFGSRRDCAALLRNGSVSLAGRVVDDPDTDVDPTGLQFTVNGQAWAYHAQAVVLLHKPAGYECSRKPRHHPSVLSLLPMPLRTRGLQPIGRLDEDTTGLLLLTDQGALIHRLTHPKHHVPKVYDVSTKHPVDETQIAALLAGVVLHDDPTPAVAATCEALDAFTLRMTLTDGRYHQVKRMLAAVGNRVEGLHRSAFGILTVPPALAPGQWCWLADDVVDTLAGR
jgi:16S rRNA pseudouridine516 synthase